MNEKPLISIIINNFNYGRFLADAIDSALHQTYENIEVIVVDDGSKDHSREIIAAYGRIIIPVLKENGGQGSAYNAGFSVSHGEFICNLDADDSLLLTAMERAIPLFDNEEIVKVQWPLWIVDAEGNNTGEISVKGTPPDGNLKEMVLENGPFYDFYFHVGSIVRRNFLQRVLPMPESPYRNGGDVYLTTLAPIFGLIRNCMEPLGTYRSHGSNLYLGRELDEDRILNYINRFVTNCIVLEKFAKELGCTFNPEMWKKRNFNYLWPTRLLQAKLDIKKLVQEGASYILVNGDEWGSGEPVAGRHAVPFTERDGEYKGPSVDDDDAIDELERLRKAGAGYIIFWWTSFWWLDHYKRFQKYISLAFTCILKTDAIIIFDLNKKS